MAHSTLTRRSGQERAADVVRDPHDAPQPRPTPAAGASYSGGIIGSTNSRVFIVKVPPPVLRRGGFLERQNGRTSFRDASRDAPPARSHSRTTPSRDLWHPAACRTATANLFLLTSMTSFAVGALANSSAPKHTCATCSACTWGSKGVSYAWRWRTNTFGAIAHLNLRVSGQMCRNHCSAR